MQYNKDMDIEFEWDDNKDAINYRKHHLHFRDAQYVFCDSNRLERLDCSAGNYGNEERWQTIGKIGEVIFVVYTERNDRIRLISARLATAKERRLYNGNGDFAAEGWDRAF